MQIRTRAPWMFMVVSNYSRNELASEVKRAILIPGLAAHHNICSP